MGCYLDDLCLEPVNKLSNAEKRTQREEGIEPLAARIEAYNPLAYIVVMKGISEYVHTTMMLGDVIDPPLF